MEECPRETVLVLIDANRSKGTQLEALNWALKSVVRSKDTVIALGVVDCWRKTSCFPFLMGLSISGLWERLEFPGQGEGNPQDLDELKIERKMGQYQSNLQPFYEQCIKNEVAKNSNTRWVVLDSHLEKYKEYIKRKVCCNILAVVKGKDGAAIMASKALLFDIAASSAINGDGKVPLEEGSSSATLPPPETTPCWYPLSWRSGFPRAFDLSELETITCGFAEGNVVMEADGMKIYQGILQDMLVNVKCFSESSDERFWSLLNILSSIRHRNIMNIVGYCCTSAFKYLLCDFPSMDTVDSNLRCDDLAMDFGWKARWCVALEIGGTLRYLHEECDDGPIVHLSVCSAHIFFSHGYSTMLGNFATAKWLTSDVFCTEDSPADQCKTLKEDEGLSIDVHDYGSFLLELITGKSAHCFQVRSKGQSLVDWAIPLLENGSLTQLMDPRITDASDIKVVHHIATAAFCCLKGVKGHRPSMSEVLAVVRGDELAISNKYS